VTGAQVIVVDAGALAGPPAHAVAAVEGWAQTIAAPATRRAYRAAVLELLAAHGEITPDILAAIRWRIVARARRRAPSSSPGC
jgi:hypothetical protein